MDRRVEEEENRGEESPIRHAGSRYISGPDAARRHRKSHTFWRMMMEAGRSEGGG